MTETETTFAAAYREAEGRRAEELRRALAALEAASRAAWDAHIYDPLPYIEALPNPRAYDGTGIGVLYGLPGSESFRAGLAGWEIVAGSNRP